MLAAIVLAAGASKRMGTPKALLDHGGESFLMSVLRAADAAGIERRIAVLGYDEDKILRSLPLDRVEVVRSESLEAGPIGSIRAGITAVLNHPVNGIVVWPVDRPRVAVETVRRMIEAFERTGGPIVVPKFEGRRGHPVIFARSVFEELREAPDREGARAIVHRDPTRVVEVDVEDRAILDDINTPADYRAVVRERDERIAGDADAPPS